VSACILFRIAITVYRYLHAIALDYQSCPNPTSHSSSSRYCLRSVNRNQLAVSPVRLSMYTDDVLVYRAQPSGTSCLIISETRHGAYKELLICTLLIRPYITFRVCRRRRDMYSGHARLCVRLCVCPRAYVHITAQTRM